MLSWTEATVLKEVICLNSATPSLWVGILPIRLKIVSFKVPLMELLMHVNMDNAFCRAQSEVRATRAASMSASEIDW